MFDQLDEVYHSIKKDSSDLEHFSYNSLLRYYENSSKAEDKEKVDFLLSLKNKLRLHASKYHVIYYFN
jgi:hypothetical protein